ncbi:MAG: hypothetical protein Q8S21_00705 [Candidatus Paracaedibacteraceae bacterium]|nr:hypothetical protein [Candidatus Paracaedibacteraceae bacterium]
MQKKQNIQRKTVILMLLLIPFLISGILFYAANTFEKNILKIEQFFKNIEHLKIQRVDIKKYKFSADFQNVVLKTSVKDVDTTYNFGNSINLRYNLFTKTLTMRVNGDETIIIGSDKNAQVFKLFAKYNGKNNFEFSIRFKDFVPIFDLQNMDLSSLLAEITHMTQAIRIKCIQPEFNNLNDGKFNADLLKSTAEPHIKIDKIGTVSLHIYNRYIFKGLNYTPYKNRSSTNMSLLPRETEGRSHTTVHLGDGTSAQTKQIIDEFIQTFDFSKLFESLQINSTSENKQSYDHVNSTAASSAIYTGPTKSIAFHSDSKDVYLKTWKTEYLPFLYLLASAEHQENGEILSDAPRDEEFLSVLPNIENHNPIHKTIDLNVNLSKEQAQTTIGLGYSIPSHAMNLKVTLPFSKNALSNIFKNGAFEAELDLTALFKGPITASVLLKNSDAILNDVQGILERGQKVFHNTKILGGNISTNRQFADIFLTTFAKKLDNNTQCIQLSYDPTLNKFNFDSAPGGISDFMEKLLPSFLEEQKEHKHDHCDDCDNKKSHHEHHLNDNKYKYELDQDSDGNDDQEES